MSATDPPPPDLMRLRVEYQQRALSEHEVDPDPIRQFHVWLQEAIDAGLPEPNAMTLATATPEGTPSARLVLLKQADHSGFAFFTNYLSQKARELERNPRAALVFYWPELERQVRVEGIAARTTDKESDDYFATRPPASRIGAAASPQSQPLASRAWLERRFAELRERYPDGDIPRPPHWGGYRVRPHRFEFWQGRRSRLHDRIEYLLAAGVWTLRRLAP